MPSTQQRPSSAWDDDIVLTNRRLDACLALKTDGDSYKQNHCPSPPDLFAPTDAFNLVSVCAPPPTGAVNQSKAADDDSDDDYVDVI